MCGTDHVSNIPTDLNWLPAVGKANVMSFNKKTSSIGKTAIMVVTSQDPKREGHDQGNQEERNTKEKEKDKINKQRGRKQRLYEDDLLRTKWALKSSSLMKAFTMPS
jgi:hypothetical protein